MSKNKHNNFKLSISFIAVQNYTAMQSKLDHLNRQNRRYNSNKFIDKLHVIEMSENIDKNIN